MIPGGRRISVRYYYHEMLTNLDETGSGVIHIDSPKTLTQYFREMILDGVH